MADQSAEATVGREVKQGRLKPVTADQATIVYHRPKRRHTAVCFNKYVQQ